MKINSIVAGAIEGNFSAELTDELGEILEKVSILLSEKQESWPLIDQLESIPGFSYLMEKYPDTHYEDLDSVSSEAKQIVCWLIDRISISSFSDYGDIASILYFTNLIDKNGQFWNALAANKITPNPKLIELSEKFLKSSTTKIECSYLLEFHEKESQQRTASLLNSNKWFEIYDELHRSSEEFKYEMDFTLRQSVVLLLAFEKELLLSVLECHKDIPLLWGIMDLYGKEMALNIAIDANSSVLEFSALAATLPFCNQNKLTESEMALLNDVFFKLSKDTFKFEQWMKILNKYPSRYPQIQKSLGAALARSACITSITQYVDAIHLYQLNNNSEYRTVVATCLESFSEYASESFKKTMWLIAFTKWQEWGFGTSSDKEHLFEIKASALDYAVTKYYQGCVSKDERDLIINKTYQEMSEINNMWHKNSSKLSTYWYLCLSMLQPLFHISEMEINKDLTVLMEGRVYSFQDSAENKYFNMMIR
jgi:hypothetical protein